MKAIKKLGMLFAATALLLTGCNGDGNDNSGDTSDLKLASVGNKTVLKADGKDKVNFVVTDKDGNDVTKSAEITYGDGVKLEGTNFTTTEAGEYTFVATYNGKTSNTLTITASALELSVEPSTIPANGGKAVFTVTLNGEDITSKSTITNITLGETYETGVNEFISGDRSGEFEFKATQGNSDSNIVTVTVEPAVANPLRLIADGGRFDAGSTATFTVENDGVDVTASAKIKNQTTGEYLDGNTYTVVSGTASFVAEYDGMTSPAVNIGTGEFWKRTLFMKFTNVNCGPCGALAQSMEKVEAYEDMEDRIVEMNIHYPLNSQNDDPMTNLNLAYRYAKYCSPNGLPTYYLDMYSRGIGSAPTSDLRSAFKQFNGITPVKAGLAVNATTDGSFIDVEVRATAAVAGEYYLGVALIEDGLAGYGQSGVTNSQGFIHNNVLRLAATDPYGDELGAMEVNKEVVKTYRFDAAAYDVANCKVVCYLVEKSESASYEHIVHNSVVCRVNSSAPYRFN